ncbi:UHRF1-binding protein 1-like isoform X3 [Photinus pyralis]|uniref:UHRF1-binding protein 1-like isoform X3 n=1 Tax=Photinus pyralis TaxID=7054 RepID=UPI0012673423|nr:UHRF1-binding protein 1-like isoform X3 [Photinus pyralis]
MVSIIKNQLLKHLSRFTKNLSADKVNLSTFKGEGELTNLELNEIVLTDLLELPCWLRLSKALCNKVTFRIQWTKLKSVPIHLNLDEVNIIAETCEELRPMSAQAGLSSYAGVPGKYSFIHKVIDGITVTVNTVNITFNSPAFTASVQVSRIILESKSPGWERSDLRMTRLKEPDKGQLLIFKELEWQTVRIEAKSTKDKNLTPLRLLTNQARCRITIKKRLSDCFIMGSRLVIILDDLLWVLTDSQLKAALHFLDSLAGLVQKATALTRKAKAARKLEELPEYQAHLAQQARAKDGVSAISKIFSRYDVVETSFHFLSQHIVLHLCDDPGLGRSCHPNLKDGGALQISVDRFQVDYYPYHLAKGDRKHWPRYREAAIPHTHWQEQSVIAFKSKLLDLIERNKMQHIPLSRSSKAETPVSPTSDSGKKPPQSPTQIKNYVSQQLAKLMTACAVIRINDFSLFKVTTSGKKQALKEFIAGDRERMSLPEDTNIVHAEFIYFYYPNDVPFPLPPPKLYMQVNPIQIHFDLDSCLWFNSFALNLHQSLLNSKQDISGNNIAYIDVKIEAILPKVTFESALDYHNQRDRPKTLSFQITRATITNVRSLEQSSRADLAKCVDFFHMGSLFFGTEFPSTANDFYIVTEKFLDHISTNDNIRSVPEELNVSSVNTLIEQLSREMLWIEAKDVWCISLEPVWGDFLGARAVGNSKAVPFLDAVPITVWLHAKMDPNSTIASTENGPKNADIHALAHISNLVSLQINHYQFLFLLRLSEEISELTTFLSLDSSRILKAENSGSMVVGALVPQVEVTFVMPSQCPGKESSGGDVESFVPDSSSIHDDGFVGGSTGTMWQSAVYNIPQGEQTLKSFTNGVETPVSEISSSYSMDFVQHSTENKNKNVTPPFANINLPNNLNAGLSSMKKGFSNLMTSIDSALKPTSDDASDTLSIRSDASSDSENFVVVNMGMDGDRNAESLDAMFRVPGYVYERNVEMAKEVIEEENTTTTSDHSLTSSCKRKDLVSVATFKLNKVEFLQQSVGYSSSIKVQVGNISNEDCGAIPWDEFQTKIKAKFSSRSRAWTSGSSSDNPTAKVKLRLDHSPKFPSSKSLLEIDLSNSENLRNVFVDFLNIFVTDLNLDLSMSTLTGLADLIEDEIIPIPIPMEISVENLALHLIEDRPPTNITSPGPVPMNVHISQLIITRGEDGIFNIVPVKNLGLVTSTSTLSGSDEREAVNAAVQQTCKQLRNDNDELRRRLLAFDRVSEENRTLRRSKEETDILRSCLTSAQEEVGRLLDEKKKMLQDIKTLQEQLSSERGRQWSSKR